MTGKSFYIFGNFDGSVLVLVEFGHQKKDVIGFVTDIKKNYECTNRELNPRHLDACSDVLLLSYKELKGNLHYIPSLM